MNFTTKITQSKTRSQLFFTRWNESQRRQSFSSVSTLRSNGIEDRELSVTPHHTQVSDSASADSRTGVFHSLYAAATTEYLRLSDKKKFICLTELEARRPGWRGCIYSFILTKVYWATQRLQGVCVCVFPHRNSAGTFKPAVRCGMCSHWYS